MEEEDVLGAILYSPSLPILLLILLLLTQHLHHDHQRGDGDDDASDNGDNYFCEYNFYPSLDPDYSGCLWICFSDRTMKGPNYHVIFLLT